MSDHDEREDDKRFFGIVRKYRVLITVVLTLGVLIIVGGGYWRHHQRVIANQASDLYQEVLVALLQKDKTTLETKAKLMFSQYPHTSYADLSHLAMAKFWVDAKNYQSAHDELKVVSDNKSSLVYELARLRLAKVLVLQEQPQQALELLDAVTPSKAWLALVEELKGDIYSNLGDVDNAKTAYLAARDSLLPMQNLPFLELKLNNLGVL